MIRRKKPVLRRTTDGLPENIDDSAVRVPIDGVLDLHAFHPRDLAELLPEYLAECRRKGILTVRIIHGKGTGSLRESVHAILRRLPEVVSFKLAGDRSGWGATICELSETIEGAGAGD